ncbi:MAG: carboxypeptidase-like regulatory domain-containing protein [Leadbetterella sp.]
MTIRTFKIRAILLTSSLFLLSSFQIFAQNVVSGTIHDSKTNETVAGATIQIVGKVVGTISDAKGNFKFSTITPPPFKVSISFVGYATEIVEITQATSTLNINLVEQEVMGQEVVISASRFEEAVMKSPVTVEKMDIKAIRETTAPNFYDAIGQMKGVDLTTQGLLFKSINMRGFGATGNPRVVQMIDGMDNQAPGLNFAVDNIVGMPELDVESVEVLPGAASALYGPNAINGLVLMNSKSPFNYQGLSSQIRTGLMNESGRSTATTPFIDASIRYAKAFNNKVAFKVNFGYITAEDWQANNFTNLNRGGIENGTRGAGVDTDYDGMNVYGDEVQANMRTVANTLISQNVIPSTALSLIPNVDVSRTGLYDKDLVDYGTQSFKANAALHYKLSEKVELVGQYNYGYGTTAYTGTGRYSLRGFNISQAKVEMKGDNFNLRAYTTQENSGDSYTAGLAAVGALNEIKPYDKWFGEYVGAFVQNKSAGRTDSDAHLAARAAADANLPQSGSAELTRLVDKYSNQLISKGGGRFADQSDLYHVEGIYNFKNQVKFMDLTVGSNYRTYQLRSEGTLFADLKDGRTGTISIPEYGAFVQAGKSLFKDHFKLTGSIRYDKNKNFDGQFSPRLAGVISFKDQNIRLSYQSGFRIPTTQNQYIDLATAGGSLIGGLPEFDTRYKLNTGYSVADLDTKRIADLASSPAIISAATSYLTPILEFSVRSNTAAMAAIDKGVTDFITKTVTDQVTAGVKAAIAAGQIPASSEQAAIAAQVAASLPGQLAANKTAGVNAEVKKAVDQQLAINLPSVAQAFAIKEIPKYKSKPLLPERIISYEIGYKGLIDKKLFIDSYVYFSTYKNFIGGTNIVVPTAPASNLPGFPIESGVGSANTRLGYSRPSNTGKEINVWGLAANLNYSIAKGYNVGGNYAYNKLSGFEITPEQQYAGFNSPAHRWNLTFGKRLGSGDKMGFNINFKRQSEFTWETSFALPTTPSEQLNFFTNTQVPAFNNLDAQVSFKLSQFKSILKVGATNLFGNSYYQAFGSSDIGSTYYVTINFDELFNK